jgi:hypothetical protein
MIIEVEETRFHGKDHHYYIIASLDILLKLLK